MRGLILFCLIAISAPLKAKTDLVGDWRYNNAELQLDFMITNPDGDHYYEVELKVTSKHLGGHPGCFTGEARLLGEGAGFCFELLLDDQAGYADLCLKLCEDDCDDVFYFDLFLKGSPLSFEIEGVAGREDI